MFSQFAVPFSFLISFGSFICFFLYCIRNGFPKTNNEISRILTFASTIISIPYFIKLWLSGWDIGQIGIDSNYHTAMVCFFISYLILDISLGSIYHRFSTGIHAGAPQCRSSSVFSPNRLLELPTLLSTLRNLNSKWRCDLLFDVTFSVLRLVFHTYMIVALNQTRRLEMPWLVAVVVFPLHLYWFYSKFVT